GRDDEFPATLDEVDAIARAVAYSKFAEPLRRWASRHRAGRPGPDQCDAVDSSFLPFKFAPVPAHSNGASTRWVHSLATETRRLLQAAFACVTSHLRVGAQGPAATRPGGVRPGRRQDAVRWTALLHPGDQ